MESLDKRVRDKIIEAKGRARPGTRVCVVYVTVIYSSLVLSSELKGELGWTRLGFYKTKLCCRESVNDVMERVNCQDVNEANFIERFERPNYPTVISNSQLDWNARKKWTVEVGSSC